MHTRHVFGALSILVLMLGCDGRSGPPGDPGVDAGPRSTGDTGRVCRGPSREIVDTCVVEPRGELCELASNNDCGEVELEEVWDGPDGPCLQVAIRNVCDRTLYSITCMESADETEWVQCWWSTTLPGFVIDVGECEVSGRYQHLHTLQSSELDVIAETCRGDM